MIIPDEIKNIIDKLNKAGFEAYAVGGCARDFLLGRKPKDWDIATNAKPEQIQSIFPDNVYENEFGTVGVKTESSDEKLKIVEITTYRIDEKYSDKRHPDAVRFTGNLREDLARRDFTINAMALEIKKSVAKKESNPRQARKTPANIIDPFFGQKDLKNGLVRAVGDPVERFNEDALRMLRAVRFAMELSSAKQPFTIEDETKNAIKANSGLLKIISRERIRDELTKIIMTERAADGILLLQELNLLPQIIPELSSGVGVSQNRHHVYSVFEHNVLSLKFAAQKKFNQIVRLAALLHDVGKPQAKRGEGPNATFYNHDYISARIAARILDRLRFPRETVEAVVNLIRHHMFVYDVGVVTEAAIRRLLKRAGPANMQNLIDLRVADRLGSGVPKAQPYRLRHFQYMVEKVQHDAISVKQLKINGTDIMEILQIPPGPKIGAILDVLLAEVIEDQKKNREEYLAQRARELADFDLTDLRRLARERIAEKRTEDDDKIKGRYWVK